MYVLDASAFIEEFDTEEPVATIPAVREELVDGAGYRYDAMEGAGMHVHIPDPDVLDRVKRAAESTGDLDTLSETDLRLLAAAFELDGTLVTDDYAIQNVAESLDVAIEVIAQEGITEQRDWLWQCQGCGKEFDEKHDRCPICGADLARKNPN
ncbi:nucleic acid-binding protein [Halodesulfurarchaeum formicicum]|uniref:Nucleic acid-binding protein n=1 Tax=Halodesulfurarchaeum formicicum TaxID=1873524 RepID=A0A1D8S1V0_9EURY|nr:NOB1 family endonuclease [Halodesulfurarchaeum formicicum]AOW79344.1 nucleic acid-binding protein [Halodesulfurarchaeum formicicum]APE94611.1 nucleic acid-binding protein [Halodesulfurarchaeum formicicum]